MFTIPAQEKKAQERAVPGVDETTFVFTDNGEESQSNTPDRTGAVFGIWDFIRMIFVLALVVALIYGFFYLLKRISAPKDGGLRLVRVLETRNLSGNRNLHLVEVGNQILLVGSSDTGVTLITEVTDKETVDGIKLMESEAASAAPGKNFADLLKGFWGKKGGPEAGPSADLSLEFIKKQHERLKKML